MESVDLLQRLVRVIDWVHRTGWPTRMRDTALATRIFDAWWRDTKAMGCESAQLDRRVLIEAMAAVFSDDHEAEEVEYLCTLFAVTFEAHIRSRQEEATRDV